ncbi:HAUS augmin-like complex subunit 8 [Oscarella lobularis]|uniref:HAUS augmin-like complex subunit 8 n=1 Tax=Oscarella lobularis TaxID=121494 RepID=UPI003314321C
MKDLEIAPLEEEVKDDADDASFAKKRRKVKGHIVPSRYMQTKKQAITSTSSISSKSADVAAAKAKKSLSRTLLDSSTQRSVFQSTPYDRHGFVRHQRPDLSAIHAPREVTRLNLDDSELASRWESTKAVGKQIAESSKLSGQHGSSKSKTKTTSSKLSRHAAPSQALTQGQLDLLEARVSQWVYLETLARKAAQDQEKEAHTQLYSVWSENERIRQQIHELESKILQYRYEEELDKAVDEQLAALDPVVSQLTAVKSEYPRLALALDTTRHQLPVHDLHLPENQDDLLNALGESENLLGDLSALLRRRQSKIKDFSQTMQALENAVNVEEKDAERCREFLAACGSLQLQRSSYVVQDVQMKKEKDAES